MFLVASIKLIIGFTSGIDVIEGSIALVAPFGIGMQSEHKYISKIELNQHLQ